MHRFLENKVAYAATASLFVIAITSNAMQGSQPFTGHMLMQPPPVAVAHGPMLPPDPWAGESKPVTVAHGPMLPPDPWAGESKPVTVAHGPMLPPDPWAGETAGNA
jgi:hypothetical protein